MGDYIERKDVFEAYEKEQQRNGPYQFETLINSIPAADVEPVVHGWWVKVYEDTEPASEARQIAVCCSKCLRIPKDKLEKSPYCPHCGAKMDAKSKEW